MVPLVRCLGAGSCPAVSLAPKDHLTRLCDSARPASSQVQGHPPHSSEGSRCPCLVRGITVLLAKDVMEPVPPADMKAGFFSPYIIVPNKSGGLRPILGLRILNWAFHKPPFKMLMQNCIFGCIAPCLHESSGGSPCSLERTGRAHSQLPRRLTHTCSVSGSVMRTQGFGALAPQPVGPSGQLGKEQTLADAEDLFSRYGVWIRSIRQRASRRNALSRC